MNIGFGIFRRRSIMMAMALGLGLASSACGFRPLYQEVSPGVSTARALAQIELNTRNDQIDYMVRTRLVDTLRTGTTGQPPRYRLKLRIKKDREAAAVEADTSITRFDVRLVAAYELIDLTTNQIVLTTNSRAVSSYNVVDNQFATMTARRGAEERAATDLADNIKLRLAVFLDQTLEPDA